MNPLCWTEEQWLEWNEMGEPSVEAFFTMKHQLSLFEETTSESTSDAASGNSSEAA
jgi:hypothetical protein